MGRDADNTLYEDDGEIEKIDLEEGYIWGHCMNQAQSDLVMKMVEIMSRIIKQ